MDLGQMPAPGVGHSPAPQALTPTGMPSNKGTGNRCGHNPTQPDWGRFIIKGLPRPKQVESLQRGFVDYYTRPWILPTLATLSGREKLNGDPWQNRSEGREADVLVANAILGFTEYASLRVGTPKRDGGFINRSCRSIAAHCGLSATRTASEIAADIPAAPSNRFWRAFRRLRAAGMFTVHRLYEVVGHDAHGTAVKRGRPAIKCLDVDFLLCLGRLDGKRLAKFRTRCSETLTSQRAEYAKDIHASADATEARHKTKFKVNVGAFDTPKKKAPPKAAFNAPGITRAQESYRKKFAALVAALSAEGIAPGLIRTIITNRLGTEADYCRKQQKNS